MTHDRSVEYLFSLIQELRKLPQETEWAEFKVNDAQPREDEDQGRGGDQRRETP